MTVFPTIHREIATSLSLLAMTWFRWVRARVVTRQWSLPAGGVKGAAPCRGQLSLCIFSAAQPEPAPAAEELQEIAQAQIGAGVAHGGEAPVIARGAPVGGTAVFQDLQRPQILLIIRLHGHRPTHMLQSGDLVAQTVVGQGAEVVPPGVPVLQRL